MVVPRYLRLKASMLDLSWQDGCLYRIDDCVEVRAGKQRLHFCKVVLVGMSYFGVLTMDDGHRVVGYKHL